MLDKTEAKPDRLIDLSEVTHATTLKKTKIYQLIKNGEIHPIKLGSKTVFSELEIQNWVAARIAECCIKGGSK
ncbi:MAG: helix-turn-helix domain-containing protein [Legionella sp.]|nr:helix-turn-helix domain-containing protein [Legionella sp.]